MKIFNVSIIIPFFNKNGDFFNTLMKNYRKFEQVNEVIIVFDHPINPKTFSFLKDYKINFRCIVNMLDHERRIPEVAINVGLRSAISEFCIVVHPDCVLGEDVISNFMENMAEKSFCVGHSIFVRKNDFDGDIESIEKIGPSFRDFICCRRKILEKIGFYPESTDVRDNIVTALLKKGVKKKECPGVKVFYLKSDESFQKRLKGELPSKIKLDLDDNFVYINIYQDNFSPSLIPSLNNYFQKDKVIKSLAIRESVSYYYPIVLLTSCYNEEKNIADFLENVEKIVDGIIVLDDESTDNSWDLLESEKIILKIKKRRVTFNDLENRNVLLNVAQEILLKNKIRVGWFLWLDFDERIYLREIENVKKSLFLPYNKNNVYKLPILHMWDSTKYNGEYPESENGVQLQKRLFRHLPCFTPYKIKSEKHLHFPLIPYNEKSKNFPLLIQHLGFNNEEKRKLKYDSYTKKYDKALTTKSSYEFLLKENVLLFNYLKNNDLILNVFLEGLKIDKTFLSISDGMVQINYQKRKFIQLNRDKYSIRNINFGNLVINDLF